MKSHKAEGRITPPEASIIISAIFLLIGIVPLYTMLVVQGSKKVRNPNTWIRIHKIGGYIFALLFLVMFVGMITRVRDYWEESSARIAIHVVLAVTLFFILTVKILVPRFFKRLSGHLFALGIIVYTLSFCMVINTMGHYLIWKSEKQPPVRLTNANLADENIGRTLLIEKCSVCHSLPAILNPRNVSSWEKVVNRMVEIAAPRITPDEGTIIANYLGKNYSPKPITLKPDLGILEQSCYPCHKPTDIFSLRHTRTEWVEIVKQMNGNDPNLVPLEKLDEIVDYLVKEQEDGIVGE